MANIVGYHPRFEIRLETHAFTDYFSTYAFLGVCLRVLSVGVIHMTLTLTRHTCVRVRVYVRV